MLNYQIVNKTGKENRVADALSRTTHADIQELAAISIIQPTWLNDLQTAYSSNPKSCQLLQELTVRSPTGHYSLKDGIIYNKSRAWVGSSTKMQEKILHELHSRPSGGHSGIEVTYHRVKQLFA